VCILPLIVPLTVDSACIPVCFCYQQQLYLWSLVNDCFFLVYHHDTLSTSHKPTEINLVDSNWVTENAMPVLSNFLQSEILFSLLECGGALSWCSTFTLMLQVVHPVNTLVIHFPEYSCNMELENIPWYRVVLWGYCLIFLSTYELKFVLKVILCYLMWIFLCLRVQIPCVGNTILGKLSLIHGKYLRQNSYLWLQPFTK
jgi:hypothetical protein